MRNRVTESCNSITVIQARPETTPLSLLQISCLANNKEAIDQIKADASLITLYAALTKDPSSFIEKIIAYN